MSLHISGEVQANLRISTPREFMASRLRGNHKCLAILGDFFSSGMLPIPFIVPAAFQFLLIPRPGRVPTPSIISSYPDFSDFSNTTKPHPHSLNSTHGEDLTDMYLLCSYKQMNTYIYRNNTLVSIYASAYVFRPFLSKVSVFPN